MCRALSTSLTCPVRVFAAYVKLRSRLLLAVKPIGRHTHPVVPIAKKKALQAASNPLHHSLLKPRNCNCQSHQLPIPYCQPRCWPIFLTLFSPFSEVNNDSETYDDDASDDDDEDDAGEDQQNNDLPSNERVISSQIPEHPAEDTTIIVESSRGRKRQLPGEAHSSSVCADEGCEASIDDENELLHCDAPGCRLTVSVLSRFGS